MKDITDVYSNKMDKEFQKSKIKAKDTIKDKKKTQKILSDAFRKAEKNKGAVSKVFNNLKLLFSVVKDYISGEYKQIPYGSIIAILGSVIYFVSPVDFFPDFIPGLGYIDDVFIISMVMKQVASDLKTYEEWKNTNETEA